MEALFGKKNQRKPGGTLVLYTTRHGATQRYAQRIGQPLDALVKEAAYARLEKARSYDAIVLGCPVYMGKLKGLDFFADHAKDLLDTEHRDAKEAGVFAKMGSKMGIAMNTMMDSTTSHIAEMIIEGSTMGITDNTRILHELERSECSDPQYSAACGLASQIVSFEEKNIETMKHYL